MLCSRNLLDLFACCNLMSEPFVGNQDKLEHSGQVAEAPVLAYLRSIGACVKRRSFIPIHVATHRAVVRTPTNRQDSRSSTEPMRCPILVDHHSQQIQHKNSELEDRIAIVTWSGNSGHLQNGIKLSANEVGNTCWSLVSFQNR